MLMPEIHTCAQLVVENEKLRKCLRQLKRENANLKEKLKNFEEKQQMDTLLKSYVTTRDSQTQTDMKMYQNLNTHKTTSSSLNARSQQNQEAEKLSKMMLMHSNLMKRYEKELKANMQHVETITQLNLKINELEQKLHESAKEIADLRSEKIKVTKHKHGRSQSAKARNLVLTDSDEENLREVVHQLKRERDSLARDKKKLKMELKGLDQGFFEEVEDIKYALQQSAKLNKEYDRCLHKLCARFGVPHPHPERTLEKS